MRLQLSYIPLLVAFVIFASCDKKARKSDTAMVQECSQQNIMKQIKKLPEVIKDSLDLRKENKKIFFQTYKDIYLNKEYFVIKEGVEEKFNYSTLELFYVDTVSCSIYNFDTLEGRLLTLEEWRKAKTNVNTKKDMSTDTSTPTGTVEFYTLFGDGTTIEFTPTDLNSEKPEMKAFSAKLKAYEKQHPLVEDFEDDNLLKLINNETFFDSQHYINSAWLDYFITKFKIDVTRQNAAVALAIAQEDFNAVKIFIKNGYIISLKDMDKVKETKEAIKNKIEEDKGEPFESYLKKESKIKEIETLVNQSFTLSKIQDADGYTNLRKEKNSNSEILQKINSGQKVEVLDNTGNWWLVQSKEGKKGYVHKSKVGK